MGKSQQLTSLNSNLPQNNVILLTFSRWGKKNQMQMRKFVSKLFQQTNLETERHQLYLPDKLALQWIQLNISESVNLDKALTSKLSCWPSGLSCDFRRITIYHFYWKNLISKTRDCEDIFILALIHTIILPNIHTYTTYMIPVFIIEGTQQFFHSAILTKLMIFIYIFFVPRLQQKTRLVKSPINKMHWFYL